MPLEREGSEFHEYMDQGFALEFREASHRYWIHELIGGKMVRTPLMSVTTALRVLDKPALMLWAESCGAEGAVKLERMGELAGVKPEHAVRVVRDLGMGMEAKRDAAAERGTLVHRVLEVYGRTGAPPNISDFDESVRGYVQGLCAFLLEWQPTPVAIERPVASRLHGFAGRVDLFASHRWNGRDELCLWDLKTSPNGVIYTEAHLQTAAYEMGGVECGLDPDRVMLLAVAGDGTYNVSDCHASSDDFLAVLEVSRVMAKLRKAAGQEVADVV